MEKNNSKILALKYRPKIFKDLIGQEIISQTISNAIKINKTPNAYLLTGIRGVGKTTTARLIAKALNCTNEKDQGTGYNSETLCDHCKQIENSNHIDVLEMDAASKTGIDDVRELIENAKYNPTSAKFKIFIIDEVHMLSKQAFNGLLKTLEEPPEKLKFILATTEARKIPVTILSRCQRFDLRRVNLEQIFQHLKKISDIEKGKISDDALKLLARSSEGSVRDAVSLLDRALIFQTLNQKNTIQEIEVRKMLGIADKSKIISLISYIFQGNEKEALELLKDLSDGGLDAKNFLNDFLELIYLFGRRANLGPIEKDLFLSEGEIKLIDRVSKNLNMQDLGLFWQLTLKTIEDLKIVSNEDIALKMFILQLIHIKNFQEYSDETKSIDNQIEISNLKGEEKIEKNNEETKPVNFVKEQMKNTDQIKTKDKNQLKDQKKFEIRSFLNLIDLADKNKEMELKFDLERNVKLSKFEQGKIEISFNENLNKNFIKKLSHCLQEWTGQRWIISLSKDNNLKTVHEQKIEKKQNKLEEEKNSEVYKEVLKFFPDSELINVGEIDE
tara:strand:+ start:1299 stop:2972 length:1674 start_codon:yes stop_codon:yes gene_type:complete